jgi:hypothetical protein
MLCDCRAVTVTASGFSVILHREGCPQPARDAWIEALLGARLRFHVEQVDDDGSMPIDVARTTYRRWSQLYHSNPDRLAS